MKTKSESMSNSKSNGKGNGSAPQAHASDQVDSLSGHHDYPLEQMIADAAYFYAERRGFAPDNELADWLQAEADVESSMGSRH